MTQYGVVTTTCDREDVVERIVDGLLENRLASCCQVHPIESSYWWQGKIERTREFNIVIKTRKELYRDVEAEILRHHNNIVAEILYYDIEDGNGPYLKWIGEETEPQM